VSSECISEASSTLKDGVENVITIMDDNAPEEFFAEETGNDSEVDSEGF